MADPIYYDVFEYHDLSSQEPLDVGSRFVLDGKDVVVMAVGPPAHAEKHASLYLKLHGAPPFPQGWPPASHGAS